MRARPHQRTLDLHTRHHLLQAFNQLVTRLDQRCYDVKSGHAYFTDGVAPASSAHQAKHQHYAN
jgi:hypothetical protein